VLPRSPDDTYAYYSRWILLEFLHTFDPRSGTGDPDLDSKLQTPEELSGLLNIALAGLKRLRNNGWRFSYDKTVEDVEIMYKRNSNPVVAFLMDECEEDPEAYVEKGVLQSRFRRYCEQHGIRPLTVKRFSYLLKDQSVIPISDYRPFITGERVALPRCWLGVRFKDDIVASTESMVLPSPNLRKNEIKGRVEEREKKGEIGYTETMDSVDAPCAVASTAAAQDAARNEHFEKLADDVASKSPGKQEPPATGLLGGSSPGSSHSVDSAKAATRNDPRFKAFKERMSRRKCILCGRSFPYDLTPYSNKDEHGYICTTCMMGGAPPEPEHTTQEKLPVVAV